MMIGTHFEPMRIKVMSETRPVAIGCRYCGDIFTIELSYSGQQKWNDGELIQNALPELTPSERELLLSQTCGKCWDKLFPQFGDSEEDDADEIF
jgi:hypothetical protein